MNGPNERQLETLTAYAAWAGADWKSKLRTDWMRSGTRWRGGDYAYLQQLRNNLGPKWLASYELPQEAPA